MRTSHRRLPALNAEITTAMVAFPPANPLTGESLLPLSAMRRTAATAAHVILESTAVQLLVDPLLRSDVSFFVDPKVPLTDHRLNLGLPGAAATLVFAEDALRVCDFTFNAWGDAALPHKRESRFGSWLAGELQADSDFSLLSFSTSDMVHDGSGTLVLSEQSLLNPKRNPGWSKGAVERELSRMLGAERFAWVPGRARSAVFFANDTTAVVQLPQEHEASFEPALEIAALIEGTRNAAGRHYEVLTINPSVSGQAYLDVTLINDQLLLPSYDEPSDAAALQFYRDLFPSKVVQQINTRPLVQRGLSWADLLLLLPAG